MTRLVILAPNWLGDAVMALPAIADVRRAEPGATITVAARPAVAPLFALVPGVNDAIVLDRSSSWRAIGAALASRGFDTALLLPNSVHAALVASRAGIAERWGYRTNWRGRLLTRAVAPPAGLHQIEYYQHLVHALGFPSGAAEPRVAVPDAARAAARELLEASGWNGSAPLVAIAPGAAYGGAKRWPPSYFAELAGGLSADGVQCVTIGAAADRAPADEVERSAKASRSIVNLVGRTDLATLAGVLSLCRALVTNDSGAMHLAAAIGVSVTAIFGPTNNEATSPRATSEPPSPEGFGGPGEQRVTVLTHPVWCRPCMLRECPIDHRCMRAIPASEAMAATRLSL